MPLLRLKRFSRPLAVVIQIGIVVVIAATIGAVGFIEYSAQPNFCLNCHVMEPYYESWATSSHKDVKCIACHYAPGIKAEAMGKLQAANQVVKYVTGSYGLRPWAEIDDAACLRSGCHTERLLEGEVDYRGVRFDHAHHLGELRRGKQLRCTSCHSQIVQGDHIAVTPTTCYLCHFKAAQIEEQPVVGCLDCHPSPPRAMSPGGFVIDHPQYVRDLTACTSCHSDVVSGTGDADPSRCATCHSEEERLREFENTDMLHSVHIAEHKIECTQCHTLISHRIAHSSTIADELDCFSCHKGAHEAQKELYAGIAGHATEAQPSAMFEAQVSCTGCHELQAEIPGHGEVQAAGEATCLSCHGVRYANILPAWQGEMDRRTTLVERTVRDASSTLNAAPVRARGRADSLLRLARENVEIVRIGKAAHNVGRSDQLLRAAVELVREAVAVGSLPYSVPNLDLGPAMSENACMACHLGVERQTVSFQGTTFGHERHVLLAGLECSDCHTPLEDHGRTTLASRAACDACHHPAIGARNCAACHEGPGGAPPETRPLPVGDFSHEYHVEEMGFECGDCHAGTGMRTPENACASCHEEHHQPETRCISCHREGAKENHEREDHTLCFDCHDEPADQIDRWTRQVCLVCHTDMVDHNAPDECADCHQMPPMK
ncbi:MAG: NapC/NirT family cytochrome c [Gemmatimonadales bacterium]